jgi:hypothetical protein
MRLAFVVRLGNDTRPADGFFEGWIEEVDSYTELRFRSTDELLKFLGDRFDLSTAAGNQDEAAGGKQLREPFAESRIQGMICEILKCGSMFRVPPNHRLKGGRQLRTLQSSRHRGLSLLSLAHSR